MEQLAYPPRITPFTEPFWNGLREKRFTTTVCTDCAHMTFPPKPVCPECWSQNVTWTELKGTGVLRSFTEVAIAPLAFAKEAPYVIGLVDLDEGIRCMSRITAPYDTLVPDSPVQVVFREAEPAYLFEFEPQ